MRMNKALNGLWMGVMVVWAACLAGCSTTPAASSAGHGSRPSVGPVLRVGFATQFPPIVFERGDAVVGVEVDLAVALGQALGRPVSFSSFDRWVPGHERIQWPKDPS